MARELGLEPRITESKSGVLPLHYEAVCGGLPACSGRKLNRPARVWQQGKSINVDDISRPLGGSAPETPVNFGSRVKFSFAPACGGCSLHVSMNIGIAQINSVIGDFPGNVKRLLAAYRECLEAGADLVVTPELSLVG